MWDPTRLADPHGQPDKAARVRAMFDGIAPTYERVNRTLSLGRDAYWRKVAVQLAEVRPDDRVLDLACGTGDLTRAFATARPGMVVGCDFAQRMLDFASARYAEAAAGYKRALQAEDAPPPARLLALIAEHHAGRPETETAQALADLIAARPDDPLLAYAQACLLAAARDPAVRDPARASDLATILGFLMPGPPQMRTLALSQAANGDFEGAMATLDQIITLSGGWLPAGLQGILEREIEAYRAGRLPGQPWPQGDPLLAPPPFDPIGPFRDYPAAVPY